MFSGAMPTQPINSSEESNNQQDNNTRDNNSSVEEVPPNERLGIIVTRPKAPEFVILEKRKASFKEWPETHQLKPKELAEAGYFYTGVSDAVRCFYCFGGLKDWELEEDVWVEHARWCPKCDYLQQKKGKDFVNTVQTLKRECLEQGILEKKIKITLKDVHQRMINDNLVISDTSEDQCIERDPAILTVVDHGYIMHDVCNLALEIREKGEMLSSDALYAAALEKKLQRKRTVIDLENDSVARVPEKEAKKVKSLRDNNFELRQQTTCKICLNADVRVVFLPCGHFVSCRECAMAVQACPVCRKEFKGIVPAYFG